MYPGYMWSRMDFLASSAQVKSYGRVRKRDQQRDREQIERAFSKRFIVSQNCNRFAQEENGQQVQTVERPPPIVQQVRKVTSAKLILRKGNTRERHERHTYIDIHFTSRANIARSAPQTHECRRLEKVDNR